MLMVKEKFCDYGENFLVFIELECFSKNFYLYKLGLLYNYF